MVALRTIPLGAGPADTGSPPREPVSAGIADDDLVIALDTDATLDPDGAALLVTAAEHLDADACFGDAVIAGVRHRRPAWSPTRLRTEPTAASPVAVRAGWLRARGLDGIDPDLVFRLAEGAARVAHLPAVVSHHEGPLAAPTVDEIRGHLLWLDLPVDVDAVGDPPTVRADFAPRIDVIVPSAGRAVTDGGPMALEQLLASRPPAPGVHFLVVVGDEFAGDLAPIGRADVDVIRRPPGPFNFSAAVNQGLLAASADLVLLLNDDTEQIAPRSLAAMAAHLVDPTVAAVGALLTYPDGTVQHAGIVIDDARPLHSFVGWSLRDATAAGALVAREVVAVTGACLMARRRDLLAVGGLSTGFPLSFNDVDLCVRLQRAVGRVVVEPQARFVHHETLSREPVIAADEWDRWIARWGEIVDPWYHPGHHRPDDPRRLHRNADHLAPDLAAETDPVVGPDDARLPEVHSIVHRGRAGQAARRSRVAP